MKTKIRDKKLKLNKETVRKLNEVDLRRVVGGAGLSAACTSPKMCNYPSTSGPSNPMYC